MDSSSVVIDEGVIDRAIRGDKEAFSIIVRGSSPRVLLVAERILRSPEEAIPAVYSLFVTAFSSLKKLKSKGFLETWLLQILIGVCGDKLKDKGGRILAGSLPDVRGLEHQDGGVAAAAAVDSEVSVPGYLARINARSTRVKQAVDRLPFKERAAVTFRDWDGVCTIEIAEILRTNRENARKLLVSARRTLAGILEASEGWRACSDRPFTGAAETSEGRESRTTRKSDKKCGKNSDRLWLFVGGELGPVEQKDIVRHLNDCPVCQERLGRASIVLEAIRQAAPVDEPSIAPEKLWKEVETLLAG